MGDSETVVTQTSSVTGYASAGYTSTGYADGSSHVAPEAVGLPSESAGEMSTSAVHVDANVSAHDGSNTVDKNDYNSLMQESNVGVGNEPMDSSQAAGYDSAVNGTAVTGSVVSGENGNASENVGGAVDAQQYVDGSGMSGACYVMLLLHKWDCCSFLFIYFFFLAI